MGQAVSVVCPSCDATLKVSKPSLFGKRVACPSCGKPMLIEAPVEARPVLDAPAKSKKLASLGEANDLDALLSDTEEIDAVPMARPKLPRRSKPEAAESSPATSERADGERAAKSKSPAPARAKANAKPKRQAAVDGDDYDISFDDLKIDDGPDERPRRRSSSNGKQGTPPRNRKTLFIFGGCAAAALGVAALFSMMSGSRSPAAVSGPAPKAEVVADDEAPSAAPAKVKQASDPAPTGAAPKPVANASKESPRKMPSAAKEAQTPPVVVASRDVSAGKDIKEKQELRARPAAQGASEPSATVSVATTIAATGGSADKAVETVDKTGEAGKTTGDGSLVGRAIGAFSATAVDNTTFQLADRHEQVMVVAFLGVECPLANLYAPRLVALAKKYQGKSVGFIAVNSNAQDTLAAVRDQARSNRMTFPVLKDAGNAVADRFGAKRTPEVFVLDAKRAVRYHGMIDDQYGYQQRRNEPTKSYVAEAVDALLTSGTVALAETPVQGCHIGRVTKPAATAQTSYYRDVLPILQNRCQQCHRKGEIGPFALKDYEAARDWGPTIREAVDERRMPPWPADPHVGKFANDISLTSAEIETLDKWVDEGCPEGKTADKPAGKKFVDGWNIGQPDKIFRMPKRYHVPATGVIDYQNFDVSPVFTTDTWVQGVECRFGNRAVVHHMLVLLEYPHDHSRSQDGLIKGFFAAGAPGATYFVFPKGYAKRIPKGARLRFQMHYTTNGTPGDDQSLFGVVLAKGSGLHEIQTQALGKAEIHIPAGAADHSETSTQTIPETVTLTTLMPHLHLRGKSFTYTAVFPDGKRETLLSIPRWDFNWQYAYQLVQPIVLPKNTQIIVEAHWDNSVNNPNNILPPVDVGFGEQTFDEMFIGYVNYIPSRSVADATRTRSRNRNRG